MFTGGTGRPGSANLDGYSDYWTQGETEQELRDDLVDIYKDLTSGAIPNVRRRANLEAA